MSEMNVREILNDDRIGTAEKLVLISLATHRDLVRGTSWPSHKTIARECAICKTSAVKRLKALETKGYIKIYRKSGMRNVYIINAPRE